MSTIMTHIHPHTRTDARLFLSRETGEYVTLNLGEDLTVFINCPHKLQEIIDAAQKAADEWVEAQLDKLDGME